MDEARVICKSLGYPDALQAYGNASFGQGTGDILLDEVDCIGNESSIFYCYHGGVGATSCSHQDDAGVRCSSGGRQNTYFHALLVCDDLFLTAYFINQFNSINYITH